MKLDEAIKWLETKPKFKVRTDLNKIFHALELLNNPQNDFKTIHISGTNGKGSVAHYLASIISQFESVGLFTSPYVIKFNERIQINDQQIADAELLEYILWAKEFDEEYYQSYNESFSFFELLTIIAFKYFSDKKVNYAIIEVGIGGLLDATNVVNAKLSIITSIGLDHRPQLGNTLEEILNQKLGILKPSATLITAVNGYEETIDSYAKAKSAKVFYITDNDLKIIQSFPLTFEFENAIYTPSLQGLYQAKNASLAVKAIKLLFPQITTKIINVGLKKTTNAGRFEIVSRNPFIVLDGAHNAEAVLELANSVKTIFKDKNVIVLFTSMADKPYNEMLKILNEISQNINLTVLDYPRALTTFSPEMKGQYKIYFNPIAGFEELVSKLTINDVLVITGSIFLVSKISHYLLAENEL
ncbi:MAG: bifunctional folylpolyglutamate synthase/dihydrofolate synthase [Acholeplasmataceae bacterium]|jgi:dihydrofolate synthase/folylpolyglutamate synthase|nr:bifunctional folylpolyglutamate synthase/dihydrofolate synthase [Acholeplasmataceae bacterium]